MPRRGDSFTVTLGRTHLNWGTHRYTNSRGYVYGEGYIPIPRRAAVVFGIYNSNYTNRQDILGTNVFNCTSSDGLFCGQVKMCGSSERGDIYAKNLQGNGSLQAIGNWFANCNAVVGGQVRVTWTSTTDISIEYI
ncbi:hypothetical protein [Clostridium sp. B9]|uniref:hypothetical protein n=1 Tax=Clostridium sp. B9 TaxID=3423224 RepID=UPI003D2EE8C9